MGLKGKLIASLEVKCGGHSIFDIYHTNTHHVSNISPSIINKFEIHEGDIVKIGSVVSWNYNEGNKHFPAISLSISILFTCSNFLYLGIFGIMKIIFKKIIFMKKVTI